MSDDTLANALYPSMAPSAPADKPADGQATDRALADKIYDSRDGKLAPDDKYIPWTERAGKDADKTADELKADRDKSEGDDKAGEKFDLDAEAEDLGLDREHEAYGDLKSAVEDLELDKAGAEKLVSAHQRANDSAWARISKAWVEEATSAEDADATIQDAQAFVRSDLIDPSLRQFLETTPVGNHPGLVKTLARVARELGLK